jgi:cytochrome c2
VSAAGLASSDARLLAPDLSLVAERVQLGRLVPWLLDPSAQTPGTLMPSFGLTREEARDLAAFLLELAQSSAPPAASEARLALLHRKVSFAEVDQRVFRRTCWHCHSAPHYARGDGGPGNTGGFGFAGRGLDLSSYAGLSAGSRDERGQRRSIFAPLEDGTPRLVAQLLARRAEERGLEIQGVRGMPLGLPALSLEDIQLVETWIAQGRSE